MFKDRLDAAQQLATQLHEYKNNKDVVLLAIPRGALAIGSVLAQELNAPLDVIFVKKIGAPGNPELAIGTVSENEVLLSHEYQDHPALKKYIDEQVSKIRGLLSKRSRNYRGDTPPLDLKGKIVIIIDDGIATGNTLRLAIKLVKLQKPKKIIVAVPVGPKDTIEQLRKEVDEVACPLMPDYFIAISKHYEQFPQVEDEAATKLFKKANTK